MFFFRSLRLPTTAQSLRRPILTAVLTLFVSWVCGWLKCVRVFRSFVFSDDSKCEEPAAAEAAAAGVRAAEAKDGGGEVVYQEEEEEEIICVGGGGSKADRAFDEIVGALEEVVLDDGFQALQDGIMDKHCHLFEDAEENRLEHMDVFKEYQAAIESHLDAALTEAVPGFDMAAFGAMLEEHREEMEGSEIFDMLATMSDFEEFKALMVAHKAMMDCPRGMDVAGAITVSPAPNE